MTQDRWIAMSPGISRRTVAAGVRTMQVLVRFDADAVSAVHSHPHEQVLYLVSGRLMLSVDGVDRLVEAGQSVLLAGDVPHGARAVDGPAVVLDTFSPPREDMLAVDRQA